MVAPFKLKSTLGRDYAVDLDDTLKTKKAFKTLGYFETPPYGVTKYPDEPLFQAIETFQRDKGLRRDGVMKPEGETARALGREIAIQAFPRPSAARNLLVSDVRRDGAAGETPRPKRPGAENPKPEKPAPEKPGPETPTSGKPEPPVEKCAALKKALIAAEANERAMRGYSQESEKSFHEKEQEVNRLWDEYLSKLPAFIVENAATLADIRKLKIPRGIVLPSDVLSAKQAHDVAAREAEILRQEMTRAHALFEKAQNQTHHLIKQMESAGCSK